MKASSRRLFAGQREIQTFGMRRGRELLANIELIGQDFHNNNPWMFANIFPRAAFEAVRELFREPPDEESSRVQRERLIEQQIVLWLPEPFNKPVREFTLIVEGERARFKIDEELE